ncbi:MAG: type I-U CRISPR-associated RAMP protein Csb1/Cas7u [Gemmataceae bacterium]|nr:type I-U CRISPR-associated RAMP protein Csb1/Cas7u [Gemmataceae bacterium]
MSELDLSKLEQFVRRGAAARSRVILQPAGGPGSKVFPPTYAGAVYAMEKRRLPDYPHPVDCVLLDSVQSQANRMEEVLQQAIDEERIQLPVVEVDFTDFFPGNRMPESLRLLEPVGKVTSLQAPHRIVDAILRDSVVAEEEKPFRANDLSRESSYGQRLRRVTAQNATALFELCPTALLFGMWDSTGPKGGLGAKFERAMVSEIVGINAVRGCKTSSRIDPLGIQLQAGPLYRTAEGGWTLDEGAALEVNDRPAKLGKDGRPSEANHGNVTPSVSEKDRDGEFLAGGVTIDRAEQSIVLSFPALRRLRFPLPGDVVSRQEVDVAARTVLAALGLSAAALMAEAGLDLRSRCLLWPTEPLRWELLGQPGEIESGVVVTAEAAVELLRQAIQKARDLGLPWRTEPLRLVPSQELVKLVVKSQQLAAAQSGEGAE